MNKRAQNTIAREEADAKRLAEEEAARKEAERLAAEEAKIAAEEAKQAAEQEKGK